MLDTKCAICGNNKNTKILFKENLNYNKINSQTFSARRTPDKFHYRILKCQKCGLIFSNPVLDNREIESLYKKSDFNYSEESNYLKKTYFEYFRRNLLKNKNKNLKILEIGAGNGFFLEELTDRGYKNIYGIEPGKASVEKARKDIKKRIKIGVLKEGLFPNSHFDIILCFHTLDHIVNINNFIRETQYLLREGGMIFFVVHDTEGLSVKLLGERSPVFDIEHIYLFNEKTLRELFKKNNFINLKTFSIKNTYSIKYWLKLFPFPLLIKNTLLKHQKFEVIELSCKFKCREYRNSGNKSLTLSSRFDCSNNIIDFILF
jgi:SAM-dependent methyltransferase